MLHIKIESHWLRDIFTKAILITFCSPDSRMLHMKYCFISAQRTCLNMLTGVGGDGGVCGQ